MIAKINKTGVDVIFACHYIMDRCWKSNFQLQGKLHECCVLQVPAGHLWGHRQEGKVLVLSDSECGYQRIYTGKNVQNCFLHLTAVSAVLTIVVDHFIEVGSCNDSLCQVEVKPYVLDDQICDECQGLHCGGRYAPYFCGNIHCLRYYCEHCWSAVHSAPGTQNHRCFIKENGDRPRAINFFPSQPRVTLP